MNQSLIALVLNGVVTREAALAASPAPSEFTLELRQFLQDGGRASAGGDDDMPDSPADFSKITELREVRKLYEEAQERFRSELSERDGTIAHLRTQIAMRDASQAPDSTGPIQALREERDKLVQQITFQRQEFETKIEKLQMRIKELSAHAPEPSRGGGLFRR
jgi:chromosome segregation ATPase